MNDLTQQLDTVFEASDPPTLTLTPLDGTGAEAAPRTFPIQPFSTFKTARVLRMLSGISNEINVAELIGELIELTKPPLLKCPHCQNLVDPSRATYTDEKRDRIGCESCALPFYVKDALPAPESTAARLNSALSAIPKLLTVAPDILIQFSALALTTNQELEKAYDETNGIDKLLKEKRKFIEFRCAADAPLKVLNAFLPVIGLDFLVRELGKLDRAVATLLNQAVPPAN